MKNFLSAFITALALSTCIFGVRSRRAENQGNIPAGIGRHKHKQRQAIQVKDIGRIQVVIGPEFEWAIPECQDAEEYISRLTKCFARKLREVLMPKISGELLKKIISNGVGWRGPLLVPVHYDGKTFIVYQCEVVIDSTEQMSIYIQDLLAEKLNRLKPISYNDKPDHRYFEDYFDEL